MSELTQVCKVKSGQLDGDDFGNEWEMYYTLYQTHDDQNTECWELHSGDGEGNGMLICTGYNIGSMRSMTLALGEFVEWGAKQ